MSQKDQYPSTKEILYLLGMGTLLAGTIVMPGLGYVAGSLYKAKRHYDFEQDQKEWKKFNTKLLKRNLRRLKQQKVVEIINENGQDLIKLTQKGHTKYLRFKLEELSLKGRSWDGKWRLVMYDISKLRKSAQENFRRILKQINFFPLQKSVYLTPYKCQDEIEYLREYFNLGEEVLLLEISKLENEEYYKQYFGI
ncbi:hypothetical protein HYS92_02975 [Candidatus Daviesbacteria bacterium]|nr:hypothetical protein [Candidatus Daviesbacteria bacterium]